MMAHKNHKDANQKLALVMSFFFHILLLAFTYYLPLTQPTGSSAGYSVVWNIAVQSGQEYASKETTNAPLARDQVTKVQPAIEAVKPEKRTRSVTKKATIPDNTAPDPQGTQSNAMIMEPLESLMQDLPEASTTISHGEEATRPIDERSLYKMYQGKETGTLLELAGWLWDTVPQPQDNTDECGKVVFQITIDEFGEVIAVNTLEKTISPLVEKIYKDALTELTFSKTKDNLVSTPTSTGKVTFKLQGK
jgi:periplasmic protein TonB